MPVDINSTKSVRHVLFEVLKLEVPNSRKTRTGKIRTDADVRDYTAFPQRSYDASACKILQCQVSCSQACMWSQLASEINLPKTLLISQKMS